MWAWLTIMHSTHYMILAEPLSKMDITLKQYDSKGQGHIEQRFIINGPFGNSIILFI